MSYLVHTQEFQVHSYLVSSKKRLHLVGLLSLLQEIAQNHADLMGLGYDHMVSSNSFWVLIRQVVKMDKWPHWNEKVSITTWPRIQTDLIASRDFEIFVGDEKYGECSTDWMVLDAETRKPKRPDYKGLTFPVTHPSALELSAKKIPYKKEFQTIRKVTVVNGDLDMNLHVNNTKYSQWVLDSVPHEVYQKLTLEQYEINFIAEAYIDDEIELQYVPGGPAEFVSHFQGMRLKDGKPIFTAIIRGKN